MKIQSIQSNQNFTGNPHFISKEAHNDLAVVLENLNHRTVAKFNGGTFYSEIPNALKMNKDTTFYDKRLMIAPTNKQKVGESQLLIGNLDILINNKTGEIVKCHKPFFTRWKSVLKKVENTLKIFKEELDNPNVVKKHITRVCGLTKDGVKRLNRF